MTMSLFFNNFSGWWQGFWAHLSGVQGFWAHLPAQFHQPHYYLIAGGLALIWWLQSHRGVFYRNLLLVLLVCILVDAMEQNQFNHEFKMNLARLQTKLQKGRGDLFMARYYAEQSRDQVKMANPAPVEILAHHNPGYRIDEQAASKSLDLGFSVYNPAWNSTLGRTKTLE